MLSDREVKLAAIKAQLEGLRALQPLWHRYVDLAQSELPQLRRREAEARDKHEQLKSQARRGGREGGSGAGGGERGMG